MKKLFTIILLSLFLFGCAETIKQEQEYRINELKKETNKVINEGMLYFKDKRTNLCYFSSSLGGNGSLLTNVPCTEEVEKLIQK